VSKPPSAQASTIRARSAKAWAVVRRATQLSSVCISSGVNVTLAFGLAGTLAALRQRPLALLRNE